MTKPLTRNAKTSKKLCLSLFVIIAITIASCSKNPDIKSQDEYDKPLVHLTPEEIISISNDNPKELAEKEILDIIRKFKNTNPKTKATNSQLPITITKMEKQLLKASESENISVVRLDIEEEGVQNTAFVSADSRAPVVLAYYNSPEANRVDSINLPLIELSKASLINQIETVESFKDSLRLKTIDKISKELGIVDGQWSFEKYKDHLGMVAKPEVKATVKPILNPITDGQIIAISGPLIQVAWDIGMPYNRLMPQTCPNNWLWDERIPISSSAVAIAQILSFFRPSITVNNYASGGTNNLPINWTYLTENEEIHEDSDYFGGWVQDPLARRNMVASLMRFIGEKCAINSTCTGSSVSDGNLISFLSTYGIKTSAVQGFDLQKIKTSLQNVKPVLMYGQTSSGGGSWWVIDGVAITSFTNSTGPDYTNTYFHANMGYGSYYNGYYLASSNMTFNPGYAEFVKNFKIYPDIMPK